MDSEIIEYFSKITDEEKALLDGHGKIDKSIYSKNEKDVISSKMLLHQGRLITMRPHTRFVHFPRHTHDYIEVVYMLKGKTTHIIDEKTVILNQGELLFLNKNARQEIMPAKKEDVAVNFIVLDAFFDQTIKLLENDDSPLKAFLIDFFLSKTETSFLHFEVSNVTSISNLVENLLLAFVNNEPNKRQIAQVTMGLLILNLMNFTDKLSPQDADSKLTLDVLKYIEENYSDASLVSLSELLHYDFCFLSKKIKELTGQTFTALLQKKRLSQACFLLKSTTLDTRQISNMVGYENKSYFYRLFFEEFQMTPKKFREKNKTT